MGLLLMLTVLKASVRVEVRDKRVARDLRHPEVRHYSALAGSQGQARASRRIPDHHNLVPHEPCAIQAKMNRADHARMACHGA